MDYSYQHLNGTTPLMSGKQIISYLIILIKFIILIKLNKRREIKTLKKLNFYYKKVQTLMMLINLVKQHYFCVTS